MNYEGIKLHSVRNRVTSMNGQIEFISEPNKGITFVISVVGLQFTERIKLFYTHFKLNKSQMIFKKLDLLTINHKLRLVIDISQIIMLKGDINYTCFYLQNGKQKISARSLKFYENQLSGFGFIRVHRAFIINPNFIIEHCESTSQILLLEGHFANISRRKRCNLINTPYVSTN